MSEKKCFICDKGATSNMKLINNPDMVDELASCCREQLDLGKIDLQQFYDQLISLNESERKLFNYHNDCRKTIVNKIIIKRLHSQREQSGSTASALRGPGRPYNSTECNRPKRIKSIPKTEVCLFSTCSFCPNDDKEPLHRVFSDRMGENLLNIQLNTNDDNVRTCVTELGDSGDASALEKYYHRKCLRSAQRTCTAVAYSNVQLIRSACDEELLQSVENTLTDADASLNISEINDAYLSILKRYQVKINDTENYRKHLKKLISDRLPLVQFIKPLQKNESEKIVLPTTVSKAIDLRSALLEDGETIGSMKTMAAILRQEMVQYRQWSFTGKFDDFENPPLLQFFLTHLLFGRHFHKASGMRNAEVDKAVDISCEFLIQNTRTDRQIKHQPKSEAGFQLTVQTPLSIGLPLAIHSRLRDKNIINNLSEVYLGCHYQKIIHIEKLIQQGVLERMKESGGFCLPDFVKKGVNIWFAVDNIDLLEDTPTGQNTFHGTVIVINQREVDGESVNGPLVIPEKLLEAPLKFNLKYLQEPVMKKTPIRFATYQHGKRKNLLSKDFTHIWALAHCYSADNICNSNTNNRQVKVENQKEAGQHQVDPDELPNVHDKTDSYAQSILSLQECVQKGKKLEKEAVMPTWAATKSLLLSQSSQNQGKTNSEVIAPLFKTSPTDYATLYTVLVLTQGISAFVVGPNRRTIITLDMDLYNRALQIQQSVNNTNWILRAGGLHIAFAALHALGKTINGSGMDTCAIESGTYTSAALRGIYGGKAYKRGVEYHIVNSLAIMMMRFDTISSEMPPEPLSSQCDAFKKALHQRSPDMVVAYNNLQHSYTTTFKPLEEETNAGELAQFLLQYLEQVESLLQFIGACRSGDWEGYLAALENQIKYFFAYDQFNYARLMPVHLAQMNALEQDDPSTWEALRSGDFVVAKSEIPFTLLYTDQTLEQEIKKLKRHGGMVGLSQDDEALDRLVTTTPHLSHLVHQFLNSFAKVSKSSERKEHYQLSGAVAVRIRENADKLRQCIQLHCEGNPFTVKTTLKNIVSSAVVTDIAKEDILHFQEKGQKRFEEFVNDRLLPTSIKSIWDTVRQLKMKTFSNWMEKTKVQVGDKIIKLRDERELLARFLIIQGSRPELVPKLEEMIGEYEMSVVPRSLCSVDGSLYIPADKASLMHAVEGATAKPVSETVSSDIDGDTQVGIIPHSKPPKVLIVDAMAVLQSMKKTSAMLKLSDLQDAFIKRIEYMMDGYSEGRVVFDRYQEQSLKNKTRNKRAVTSIEFKLNLEMKLTMSLKELLSSSSTKANLTSMLAQALLQYFSEKKPFKMFVVYDVKIKSNNFEENHSHEEADTLICHQVLASVAESDWREVCVWSPDTDVFTILLDLASCGHLGIRTRLQFLTGNGTKYRKIDVLERVRVIGVHKCQGLIGLHNFSGADWGGKFVGITKKTWINAYMKLDDDDPIVDSFRKLGEIVLPTELVNGNLPPQVKDLERFVCQVYSSAGPKTLPALRWQLFRSKNLEGEMLPPTRAALLPHITRSNYISMRDKSYVSNNPKLPVIEENGWHLNKGAYVPVRCLTIPAPRAVIELTRCACKTGCSGRCSCCKNGLRCTPLCKCYAADCTNISTREVREEEDD